MASRNARVRRGGGWVVPKNKMALWNRRWEEVGSHTPTRLFNPGGLASASSWVSLLCCGCFSTRTKPVLARNLRRGRDLGACRRCPQRIET